jgi:hypothetical protein
MQRRHGAWCIVESPASTERFQKYVLSRAPPMGSSSRPGSGGVGFKSGKKSAWHAGARHIPMRVIMPLRLTHRCAVCAPAASPAVRTTSTSL